MPFKKKRQTSLTVISLILAAVMAFYSVLTLNMQVFSREKYYSQVSGYTTRSAVIKAPRGEILDCYGREIASNRDGYNIVFNRAYIDMLRINDTILTLTSYLSSVSCEWTDKLPITKEYPFEFTEENNENFLKKIGLARYATSENAFDRMVELFSLQEYSNTDKRTVMGVRYSMLAADFSVSNPFVLAEDVSSAVMAKISESGLYLDGVTVDTVPFRKYADSSLAPNIVGSIGPIYAEEWENYKDKGYSFSDKVGKSGIEAYAEEYLHGKDGILTYTLDRDGKIVSSEVTQAPTPGKTVMLTIDKSIQTEAQSALKDLITEIKSTGSLVTGGAAVVMNVNSGAVLAAANFPSYDLLTLSENYNEILNNPNNPLLNRAFQGIYPIGSTMKPLVSVAGLDTGVLTAEETIVCQKTYRYFKDYTPSCMGTHGPLNLTKALSKSCNYYFFEVGRRIGAKKLTEYFKAFGLGVKTGVEIDDSSGLLSDVEEGSGDTLQISIGQKNAFTPLQLAVYTSTLVNGGTRYKTTLISKIVSLDKGTAEFVNAPTALGTVKISDYAEKSVKKGMASVVEEGTGSTVMHDYPIKVGGKTGTSQNSSEDHSLYIAFAPFDNPEIAISIVLEHGHNGLAAGRILKRILDKYFFTDNSTVDNTPSYTLYE